MALEHDYHWSLELVEPDSLEEHRNYRDLETNAFPIVNAELILGKH